MEQEKVRWKQGPAQGTLRASGSHPPRRSPKLLLSCHAWPAQAEMREGSVSDDEWAHMSTPKKWYMEAKVWVGGGGLRLCGETHAGVGENVRCASLLPPARMCWCGRERAPRQPAPSCASLLLMPAPSWSPARRRCCTLGWAPAWSRCEQHPRLASPWRQPHSRDTNGSAGRPRQPLGRREKPTCRFLCCTDHTSACFSRA